MSEWPTSAPNEDAGNTATQDGRVFDDFARVLRSVASKQGCDFATTKASIDLCTHIEHIVNKTLKSFLM